MIKRFVIFTVAVLAVCQLCAGCGSSGPAAGTAITDALGNEILFESCPQRVVALSGSLGDVWLCAGGQLIAATDDAVTEGRVENIPSVGGIKEPNIEAVLALDPDFVILSADIASHPSLADSFREMGVACGLFRVEFLEDYLGLLLNFCALTGREDLYRQKGIAVKEQIEAILAETPRQDGERMLLLRVYSGGCRAKRSDNLAGTVLADFGYENLLDSMGGTMEELSVESIIVADPDVIFLTAMGDEMGAMGYFEQSYAADPAWQSLRAVQSGRVYMLPKHLFHYKPNDAWGDAYAFVAALIGEKVE